MPLVHIVVMVASLWALQTTPPPAASCREWRECQRLAQDAYERGDYERFHDLAWRTMQTGPARDPELMYLLARAQSLSGRPHDALVMLGRLADMGFATDAATADDFRAVRELRQWPELEAVMTTGARLAGVSAPVAARPTEVAPVTPPADARPADVSPPADAAPTNMSPPAVAAPRQADEALRIPGAVLGSAGFAYDRVSSRFIVADAGLRKLLIIDERSRHLIDLVTSASAGFYDITGFEIDPARGDLWVVSAESQAAAGDRAPASALHKLQLVSGRPLTTVPVPADLGPCRLADVAVTPDGRVLMLDTAGTRVLRFRADTRTFAAVAALHMESPASLAPAGDRIVYVAHASGIARVDTATGAVQSLASSRDVPLGGFERIRWSRDSLVGVQRLSDGSQRAVRIKIVDGRAAVVEIIDNSLSTTDQPVSTVSGDDFYFLVRQPAAGSGDIVIRRSRLR